MTHTPENSPSPDRVPNRVFSDQNLTSPASNKLETRAEQWLRKELTGQVESVFQQDLGVPDPKISDYIADLMFRFIRNEQLYKIRSVNGKPATSLSDMLSEVASRPIQSRAEGYKHIGDYVLFWSGYFPEALEKLQADGSKDHLLRYTQEGKRSYFIASSLSTEENSPRTTQLGSVLAALSSGFEMCCYGLREIRRSLEEGRTSGGLIL